MTLFFQAFLRYQDWMCLTGKNDSSIKRGPPIHPPFFFFSGTHLTSYKLRMANLSQALVGVPYKPSPWEIAHELYYWDDPSEKPDIPLPKEWYLVHKDDEKNPSGQHMLEINPRGAFTNLRVNGYIRGDSGKGH